MAGHFWGGVFWGLLIEAAVAIVILCAVSAVSKDVFAALLVVMTYLGFRWMGRR